MTEPEAPPPSDSPPTTREGPDHREKTGGLDPDPPDPGILSGWPPHAFLAVGAALLLVVARHDALLLVLSALLLVAAWEAWVLARLDARHRPVAIGLVAMAACMLVREVLHVTVLRGGPYFGWARVAFHVEEATRLATAALPAWMALGVLTRARKWIWNGVFLALPVGLLVYLVAMYPELRGDALRRVYLVAELGALLVAVAAILSWARRRGWRSVCDACVGVFGEGHVEPPCKHAGARWYTWAPIIALVVGDLLLLPFGAWRWGLFGPAYVVQQGGLLAVWGVVVALQGAALVMARRRA